eukprot:5649354-Pleurochrysis_carterae.AAC.2
MVIAIEIAIALITSMVAGAMIAEYPAVAQILADFMMMVVMMMMAVWELGRSGQLERCGPRRGRGMGASAYAADALRLTSGSAPEPERPRAGTVCATKCTSTIDVEN